MSEFTLPFKDCQSTFADQSSLLLFSSIARHSRLANGIAIRLQLRVTARQNLRPRLDSLHVIRRRQALVRLEVMVEIEYVSAVVGGLADGDEAVDGGGAYRADDEVELRRTDVRGCGGGGRVTVIAERVDLAAQVGEPDHYFVVFMAGAAGADEGVIGDVGTDAVASVAINSCQRAGSVDWIKIR